MNGVYTLHDGSSSTLLRPKPTTSTATYIIIGIFFILFIIGWISYVVYCSLTSTGLYKPYVRPVNPQMYNFFGSITDLTPAQITQRRTTICTAINEVGKDQTLFNDLGCNAYVTWVTP